ncbi:2349_t:CDS:10, partial [Entrophospora sp. SA101]
MNNLKKISNFTLPRHRKTEPTLLWWTKPSIQYSTVKLDSQPFPVLNITLPSHVTIDCKFYTKDDDTLTFLADFSANLELFNDGSYKFTPTENMINSSGLLLLSWNNIPGNGISVIGFCEELVDIKNNYPGQANLQNYIDYLQYNFVYIQENKKNYLIRDWTNYLGFPNHHISLRIPEPIASAPIVGYNRTTVSIVPYGYTNRYFETVETEKRFETVLSNVGPLGGTISILLGIYAIYLLLKNLPVIPLTEKTHLHYERSKDPNISEIEDPNISEIKKDLASLTTRFHSLETILREYVINSDFLDELETGKTRLVLMRKNYLIRDWTNYLGFPNHHISLRIPEPIASAPIVGYNRTTVSIVPYGYTNRYFETVETEKRFETVLSNVGPLGGTISILLGIYAIYLLLKNLPVIPLTEKTHLHYERSKDPNISEIEDPNISEIKKDLASLTTRFHSLETILREYVINSDFLDELETGKT